MITLKNPEQTRQVMNEIFKAALYGETMRSEYEILKDLKRIEIDLSPENLTHDGELPPSAYTAESKRLYKERAKLVKELGREPTEKEIWGL